MKTTRAILKIAAVAGLLLLLVGVACLVFCRPRFHVERGVNISHWLSQSQRRGVEREAWFNRNDVALLAGLGFDHLRIPVDEEQMWDESGKPDPEAFALLNRALDWCAQFRLRAVVDLHILRSHHFNKGERPLWTQPQAQERFLQCWRDLSEALHERPNAMVAYELLNEPVAPNAEDWNLLVAKAHAVVRAKEPKRVLVIGSNSWQSTGTFDRLKVPANDPNILLSFHFYEPFRLTHHQASWVAFGAYRGPVKYPGQTVSEADLVGLPEALLKAMGGSTQTWDRDRIRQSLSKPLALAKSTGLPLYCGEWGCLSTVPRESRLAWYRDMVDLLQENHIGWAIWDYKGGFGILRDDMFDARMLEILFSKPGKSPALPEPPPRPLSPVTP